VPEYFNNSIITINVFPNCAELQKTKNVSENVCAFFSFEDGSLAISLTSWASEQTIKHELTHAVVGELLGGPRMATSPLWFMEGLAEYESPDYLSKPFKIFDRLPLWQQKPNLMTYEQLLIYKPGQDVEKDDLFCRTSLELIRYMLKQFGENSPQQILLFICEGYSFDKAVKKLNGAFNGGQGIYENWVQSFF
jgi:hypothetical protein